MNNYVVCVLPIGVLAQLSAVTSAGTMLTMFGSQIFIGYLLKCWLVS